jgi:hypothetical protein
VNEPAETIATQDRRIGRAGDSDRGCWLWRSESQRPVGTMPIVVVHERGRGVLEVVAIENEQAVETFGPNGAHEPLRDGIRLRRSIRRAQNFDLLRPKHLCLANPESSLVNEDPDSGLRSSTRHSTRRP